VSTLGIGGVALGFAFKDIFQNFVAGILLLVGQPFRVGDQIRMGEHEGTVDEILTRATYLKTYDGRRVIIPNSDLFTNAVTVNTAFATRRMEYDIGIGYGDDIEAARAIVLGVLGSIDGVLPDPKADVIVVALADSTVVLRARWWSSSRIGDLMVSRDKVLTQCKQQLTAAGIDLPFPTQQILFHDQTEESDGDRAHQREGWPAGKAAPRAAGVARAIAGAKQEDDTPLAGTG
jgi:small conductance mechanosensitive channel